MYYAHKILQIYYIANVNMCVLHIREQSRVYIFVCTLLCVFWRRSVKARVFACVRLRAETHDTVYKYIICIHNNISQFIMSTWNMYTREIVWKLFGTYINGCTMA